ncbi:molybdate ABC transporter substrate-binding protein [Gloeothece verrucosa]|uniref:Molybdenum ABC transporter, periplasmic molybdate-binding protein n=1 Tax=Gloeothece verrucosa (strain PCC 7822) TaxID=497965 RepID=E0UKR3_GLOV7|nr:molybdate ABC transporter substrate-binding protein [Gloeothece verrucosa]ADN17543.1 molybdenum ABC transporter, periplasmic molybdate-binding protein [Gloeothece verrucosa PCC 7822]
MKRKNFIGLLLCLMLTFIGTVSCSQSSDNTTSNSPSEPVKLTISAAISLKDALTEIKKIYQPENFNPKLTYNFGSSGTLQQQIEQGAPIDVFISAAPKQINALEAKKLLLEGTRQNLLKNNVVLVVAKNTDEANISDFKDLTNSKIKRLSIGDPGSVPAGQYGKEVLTFFNIYEQIKPKIVFAKDVRQVLAYLGTGNLDAGIVYGTDALTSDKVRVVATASENTHQPIIYPISVLKNSKNVEAAQQFIQFLSSPPAQTIFEKYGFKMAQ